MPDYEFKSPRIYESKSPKVKSLYKKYYNELAEVAQVELAKIGSAPVFVTSIPGYDDGINGRVSWRVDATYITLPATIDSHFRLYVMAHEIGHIVYRHMLRPGFPEDETTADKWALEKFDEWGLKVTTKIKEAVRIARAEEARARRDRKA